MIDQLYRKTASIGDGGTADALRHEFSSGQTLKHLSKALDRIKNLQSILKEQKLTANETKIVYQLLGDLFDAVKFISQ